MYTRGTSEEKKVEGLFSLLLRPDWGGGGGGGDGNTL